MTFKEEYEEFMDYKINESQSQETQKHRIKNGEITKDFSIFVIYIHITLNKQYNECVFIIFQNAF